LQYFLPIVADLKKAQEPFDKHDANAITKGRMKKLLIGEMNFNALSQAGIVRSDLN
jgi:hypothetical protein